MCIALSQTDDLEDGIGDDLTVPSVQGDLPHSKPAMLPCVNDLVVRELDAFHEVSR